jgi:hypothetical protein
VTTTMSSTSVNPSSRAANRIQRRNILAPRRTEGIERVIGAEAVQP